MSSKSPWQRFIARTAGTLDKAELAKRTGVSPATVTRWFQRDAGSAEHVIAIARAFGDDPKLALVETGHLTMEEATKQNYSAADWLARLDELDLAREIVRRLEEGEAGDALNDEAPLAPVIDGGFVHTAEPSIPDDIEDSWAYAAHPDTPEPEDNTP